MEKVETLEMDAFKINELADKKLLVYLARYIFQFQNIYLDLDIDQLKLDNFLSSIQSGYF